MTTSTLPAGWQLEPLGSRVSLLSGFAFESSNFAMEGGEALIRIRDLKVGRSETRYVGSYDERYLVTDGDFLIGMDGEFGCHKWQGGRALLNQRVCKLIGSSDVDLRFVAYGIGRHLKQIEQDTSYTTVKHLSGRQIRAIPFAFPPLAEQRRIANRLDEALAEVVGARTALDRQFSDCGRLKFALIDEVLGGRAVATNDPADQPDDGWVALSSVARLESGHTPSRKRPEWWCGDVPWIALPDIRALDGTTAEATNETTNELGLANSSARLLPKGTVVLSRTASVGFVTVMGKPMATSQDFVNWVPGAKLRSWYLAYALIGARDYLRGLSSGAVHKTIYMPTLKSLHIRKPSLHEQDHMVERIRAAHSIADETRKSVKAQSSALDALPASLLSAAFRGEL